MLFHSRRCKYASRFAINFLEVKGVSCRSACSWPAVSQARMTEKQTHPDPKNMIFLPPHTHTNKHDDNQPRHYASSSR